MWLQANYMIAVKRYMSNGPCFLVPLHKCCLEKILVWTLCFTIDNLMAAARVEGNM